MSKKILSMLLVLSMMFTMLPVLAMAEEADFTVESMEELIELAPLDKKEKTVTTDTSLEDLELYEALTSTMQTNTDTVAENGYDAEKLEDFRSVNYALASETSENIVTGDGYEYNTETKLLTITNNDGAKYKAAWRDEYKDTVTSINVEDAVTSIGDSLFNSCPNLTSITIGRGVSSIGLYVFDGSDNLTTLIVHEYNTSFKTIDNILFTKDGKELVKYPRGKSENSYTVPDGVITIGFRAFYGNKHIECVSIPDSVTKIDAYAFNSCNKLKEANLGDSVKEIGSQAFLGCSNLTDINFPAALTIIGKQAFSDCKALESIVIPAGVNSIGGYAFTDCTKLKDVIMYPTQAPAIDPFLGSKRLFNISMNPNIYIPKDATGYTEENGWTVGQIIEGRAALSDLKLDSATLSPAFSPNVTSYTVNIPYGTTSITIVPTIGLGDSLTVNGYPRASGESISKIMNVGENIVTIVVSNDDYPDEAKTYTIVVTRNEITRKATPSAVFTATDASGGTLTNVTTDMVYSVNSGINWLSISSSTMNITEVTVEHGIQIKEPGDNVWTSDSFVQTIDVNKASVPDGIGATDETSALNDGTITGVSELMEYRKDGESSYEPIAGSTITNLAPGIYHVRYKANGTMLASEDFSVEIVAFTKKTPVITDLSYDLSDVSYNGSPNPLTVTAEGGKDLGEITVRYNGSSMAPTNAGTYSITVDIAGSSEYNSLTELYLGSYNILKINYTGTTALSASILESGQAAATVTLPALPEGACYGTPTASGNVTMTDMSIEDAVLTYTAPTSTAGETGIISIPVTGATNYNDYNLVVTITYTAKTPQAISYEITAINKTYGDEKFINALIQTTVNAAITYTSDNTSVAVVDANTGEVTIVGSGIATITATAAETVTHAQAMASYTVTVAKKALTFKADDKSMTRGEALPAFTYTVTGLVNDDIVTTEPALSTSTDGNVAGTFDITITGGVIENAANYDITYINGTLTVAECLYTVTVTGGTGSGTYAEGTTVTITANDRSGYIFTGWTSADVTFIDATARTTSFTMPAKAVTVTANYRQSTSGGSDDEEDSRSGGSTSNSVNSGSDGSSSGDSSTVIIIVIPPAPDQPDSPTQAEIKVPVTVDADNNVTVNITSQNVTEAYEKALAEAKKNGNEENGITLVLNVDTGNKAIDIIKVNLPKAVQDAIIAKKIVNTIIVVDNPDIQITMDLTTVKEINRQANADVNVTSATVDSSNLTDEAKRAIGSRPVYDLKVNYGSGRQVENFGDGSVTVTIPYTLGENEKAENICAVYIDDNGKVHWLTDSVYDSVEKVLRFSTNHFSLYGVGYKEEVKTFTDIENHWAKNDIEFVVRQGLFNGTSETSFSPNMAMTRGMFVTVLGRMAKADVSGYKESSFTDVKEDAYYMGYIEWARESGIIKGTGDGKFAPDQSISREQMAVILVNYAKTHGFKLPKVNEEKAFADSDKISAYAKEAVQEMQMSGIINGKDSNLFDPKGMATRAEVSAVLRRFVELISSGVQTY